MVPRPFSFPFLPRPLERVWEPAMGDSCGLHIHPRDSQSLTQYSRMPFLFSGQTSMKQFIPSLVASLYSIPVLTKILSGLIPHYSLVPRLRNLAVWDWERDWYRNAETRDTTTHPIKWPGWHIDDNGQALWYSKSHC